MAEVVAYTAEGADDVTRTVEVSAATPLPVTTTSTLANGADVAQGSTTDAAQTDYTLAGTVIQWLKGLVRMVADVWNDTDNYLRVSLETRLDSTNDSIAVAGNGIFAASSPTSVATLLADNNATVVAAANLRLIGVSVRETAGAAAVMRVMHGATVAGGALVAGFSLAANESKMHWYGPAGVAVPNGLSLDWISGSTEVVLFTKAVA